MGYLVFGKLTCKVGNGFFICAVPSKSDAPLIEAVYI